MIEVIAWIMAKSGVSWFCMDEVPILSARRW